MELVNLLIAKGAALLMLALLVAGCAPKQGEGRASEAETPPSAAGPAELNVFAAASLSGAFGEIGKRFEAEHPGIRVALNFAGSQQLAQQIIAGAPADAFASANLEQMQAVIQAGGIISGTQRTFVQNRLIVVVPKENPAGLATLQDLAKPGLKLVLAAQEVPAGQYARDFLDKAAADPAFGAVFKNAVLQNVVSYEENVKAVVAKVALSEADAGIVYTSDAAGSQSSLGRLDIPDGLNVAASYPIAVVKESQQPELARAFIDLVLSAEGQEILAKYGFLPVR